MNPIMIINLLIGLKGVYDKLDSMYSDFQKSIDASISAGDLKLESLNELVEKMKNEGKVSRDFKLPTKPE
mgnify:CR=1 FL=1